MQTERAGLWARLSSRVDWALLGLVGLLASLGMLNLYSGAQAVNVVSHDIHIRQAIAFMMGFGLIGVMTLVKTRVYARSAYLVYGVIVALLVVTMIFGTTINGSRRWINIGLFLMQPSELLKLGVILITARYFHDRDREEPLSLKELLKPFGLVGLGVIFVLKQPDLGTSLTILAIFMSMVLFERVRLSSLMTLALTLLISLPFAWTFGLKEYQKDRVISFLNLDEDQYGQAWQVRQSIIAFGSGRVWGKGHLQGTQIAKGFVPEHENDFASANWAEEHGFVGMLFLLSIYMALIVWALRISSRAPDRFGVHIGVGMAAFIFWHVLVNLCMVTGMLPVVGLPLPLVSAGRSSLLTIMLGLGLLANVSVHSRRRLDA